jgi:hypothetical protein
MDPVWRRLRKGKAAKLASLAMRRGTGNDANRMTIPVKSLRGGATDRVASARQSGS